MTSDTIEHKDKNITHDFVYQQDNKIWAKTAYSIPDEDTNVNFELRSHPEIVNGLASQFRDYLLEQDYSEEGGMTLQ